eukprot:2761328-Rhodomonas_salina.1
MAALFRASECVLRWIELVVHGLAGARADHRCVEEWTVAGKIRVACVEREGRLSIALVRLTLALLCSQAARLAVLNRPEVFTKILVSCRRIPARGVDQSPWRESEDEADKKKNGPVDAKKCEELLTHSTEKLMSGRQ